MKYFNNFNTCCFIGGSIDSKLFDFKDDNQYFKIFTARNKEKITNLIENFSVKYFISGMELGFEQYAAETVLELKHRYPEIQLECVLPYETQSINWTESQRDKYYSIIERSDREVLLQYHYSNDSMRKRDFYMINKSKYIIVCKNGTSTSDNLIRYAKSIERIVFTADPGTLKITPGIKICK